MPIDGAVKPSIYMEASGTKFRFDSNSTHEIYTKDIVRSLARVPRFNTQTRVPYYVSQHSQLVRNLVQAMGGNSVVQLQALLHDATEAYIGDIPAPVKTVVPEIKTKLEEPLWRRIAERYRLPVEMHALVKHADWIALFLEAKQLCSHSRLADWSGFPEYEQELHIWAGHPEARVPVAGGTNPSLREDLFALDLKKLLEENDRD